MKKFKNTSDVAVQSDKVRAKSQKHDANLQKNSGLYFQVGLILALLATYGLFEMKFESTMVNFVVGKHIPDDNTFAMTDYRVEQPQVEEQPVVQKRVVLSTVDPIIKDDNSVIDKPIDIVVPTITPVVNIPTPVLPSKPEPNPQPDGPMDLNRVQKVPVYPGCEYATTNAERLACMSDKLGRLVQKKFDSSIAGELGLTGIQRIYVQFTIDKQGNVKDIKSRAPFTQLEDEASRVVNKIPLMTPGRQNDRDVDVIYTLPIIFKVQ